MATVDQDADPGGEALVEAPVEALVEAPVEVRDAAPAADPGTAWASADALSDLYEKHGSVLLAFLIGITHGDRHRAEDFLQETFLRAWRHPEARTETGEWRR